MNCSGEWRVGSGEEKIHFDFERLVAYQKSLDFADRVFALCEKMPLLLQSSLGDQLRRASLSIVNNIAEGSGQMSAPQRRRYFQTAWNSARERVPMFEVLRRRGVMDESSLETFRSMCAESCRLVSGLLKSLA